MAKTLRRFSMLLRRHVRTDGDMGYYLNMPRFYAATTKHNKVPSRVKLVEVGPRDGLQNEEHIVNVDTKVELINRLSSTGLKYIEVSSFVSPKWVPQMADAAAVYSRIEKKEGVTYAALAPNMQGLKSAMKAGVTEIAIFGAASETFSKKNINCTIDESLTRFAPVVEASLIEGMKVRGYVSCVIGCPYEGKVSPKRVSEVAKRLLDMGCYEISLGDTIGCGRPSEVARLIDVVQNDIPLDQIAVHFHDTYGQALANIYTALTMGVSTIDCSVAGLGGCPYAKGATGNVSTEDVVYLLEGLGVDCGVNLDKLVSVGDWICKKLNKQNSSKVGRALVSKL